jgi:hypothetical protein
VATSFRIAFFEVHNESMKRTRIPLLCLIMICVSGLTSARAQPDVLSESGHREILGTMYLSADTLNFGTVAFGASNTLTDTLLNIGNSDLTITSITATDPSEFQVIGNVRPRMISAGGSGDVYTVIFSPMVPMPGGIHLATVTFIFDGGQTRVITLIGFEHRIINADLRIDTGYTAQAGQDLVIHQFLLADLSGTIHPVRELQEAIHFDPTILTITAAAKGTLSNSSAWTITSNSPMPGEIDIDLKSASVGLQGPGILIDLPAHVLPTAQIGQTSPLTETGVRMGGGLEPTITVDAGLFRVTGPCGPIALSAGDPATSITRNSPNPTTDRALMRFWVNESTPTTHVRLLLYDQLGALVKTVVDSYMSSGAYEIPIETFELPAGVYTYTFEAGQVHSARRLLHIK